MASTYFISLGSNLGDRSAYIMQAWERLGAFCENRRMSRLYETAPLYVTDQPLFLNAVGEAVCQLDPHDLLSALHAIERALGRDRARERRMGPRTIDLDILLCGDLVMDAADLAIPHPRLTERGFVLVPLLEIAPNMRDPRTGAPYSVALASLDASTPAAGSRGVYSYPSR